MIVVVKKKGENKESLFKKFSRLFKEDNIIFEVNKKMFFKKPSLLKKEKLKERLRRRAKRT